MRAPAFRRSCSVCSVAWRLTGTLARASMSSGLSRERSRAICSLFRPASTRLKMSSNWTLELLVEPHAWVGFAGKPLNPIEEVGDVFFGLLSGRVELDQVGRSRFAVFVPLDEGLHQLVLISETVYPKGTVHTWWSTLPWTRCSREEWPFSRQTERQHQSYKWSSAPSHIRMFIELLNISGGFSGTFCFSAPRAVSSSLSDPCCLLATAPHGCPSAWAKECDPEVVAPCAWSASTSGHHCQFPGRASSRAWARRSRADILRGACLAHLGAIHFIFRCLKRKFFLIIYLIILFNYFTPNVIRFCFISNQREQLCKFKEN